MPGTARTTRGPRRTAGEPRREGACRGAPRQGCVESAEGPRARRREGAPCHHSQAAGCRPRPEHRGVLHLRPARTRTPPTFGRTPRVRPSQLSQCWTATRAASLRHRSMRTEKSHWAAQPTPRSRRRRRRRRQNVERSSGEPAGVSSDRAPRAPLAALRSRAPCVKSRKEGTVKTFYFDSTDPFSETSLPRTIWLFFRSRSACFLLHWITESSK